MSIIKLAVGRENTAQLEDMFGNTVGIGLNGSGAVLIEVRADGKNSDNTNKPLTQDVVIAFSAEQTEAITKELLRLQPKG